MMIIDPYRFGAGGLPYTPPLDANNAAAAYSIRKLRTDYDGACLRISSENSGGGTTKDVGFDSNGYLDIAELYENSYVIIWYDQTGNSNHLDRSSGTNIQPQLQISSVLNEVNGKAALSFIGSKRMNVPSSTATFKFLHDGTKSSVVSVQQFGTSANPNSMMFLWGTGIGTGQTGAYFLFRDAFGDNNSLLQGVARGVSGQPAVEWAAPNESLTPNIQTLIYNEIDPSNATAEDRYITQENDGASLKGNTNTNPPSIANSTLDLTIGVLGSFPLVGFIQEIIFFDTDQSGNKATLQSNINDYFTIY